MARVVDQLWFTNIKGTLGIVVLEEDVIGDRKAYIGIVDGQDERVDTEAIISYGNPFSLGTVGRLKYDLERKPHAKDH